MRVKFLGSSGSKQLGQGRERCVGVARKRCFGDEANTGFGDRMGGILFQAQNSGSKVTQMRRYQVCVRNCES